MVAQKLLSLMAEISTKFQSHSLDLQLFCGVEAPALMYVLSGELASELYMLDKPKTCQNLK